MLQSPPPPQPPPAEPNPMFGPQCQAESRGIIKNWTGWGPLVCRLPWSDTCFATWVAHHNETKACELHGKEQSVLFVHCATWRCSTLKVRQDFRNLFDKELEHSKVVPFISEITSCLAEGNAREKSWLDVISHPVKCDVSNYCSYSTWPGIPLHAVCVCVCVRACMHACEFVCVHVYVLKLLNWY